MTYTMKIERLQPNWVGKTTTVRSVAYLTLAGMVRCMASASQAATNFPQGPVEIIVSFAAGGGLDQNARAFSKALSESMNTHVAVVNRDGTAGAMGRGNDKAPGSLGLYSVVISRLDHLFSSCT